mmetsp:Transcript_8487/g.12345  ORF Transcript_8487/g.12345 Transcript_8487/m.12345 type:complete len:406 (+) Transcript_8487:107-1324(+)
MMMTMMASILWLCACAVLSVVCVLVILIPLTTFALALMASYYRGGSFSSSSSFWKGFRSGLYSGRVSHIRFQPVVHSFAYPLFFCCLDLDEIDALFGNKNNNKKKTRGALWPLNLLMQFHAHDHLKNGEGLLSSSDDSSDNDDDDVSNRIRRLVSERTLGKCQPKGRIFLLTHLTYFGYCFNPVSFYYVLKDKNDSKEGDEGEEEIEAIVAEVSNTPWIEMHCYVLHPHSVDVTDVKPGNTSALLGSTRSTLQEQQHGKTRKSINYIFPKTFHVSPFMSMDHTYDWTFYYQPATRLLVSTSMRSTTETDASKVKRFNARFDIQRQHFTPILLCLQLIKLPAYCIVIQIWIHVQAFYLFLKGVQFVSHPEAVETRASKIIANLMRPFFALQACYDGWKEDNHRKKK